MATQQNQQPGQVEVPRAEATGDLIAIVERAPHQRQLRITVASHKGQRYVAVRLWARSTPNEQWQATNQGVTLPEADVLPFVKSCLEAYDRLNHPQPGTGTAGETTTAATPSPTPAPDRPPNEGSLELEPLPKRAQQGRPDRHERERVRNETCAKLAEHQRQQQGRRH